MDSPSSLGINPRELRDVELAARIEVARKVGVLINKKDDGDTEREKALTLARLLIEDASISVREALSKELRTCRFLPEDVIAALSKDIDQVSTPFLMAFEAVPDDMLENLVINGSEAVQDAIAGRSGLSEMVAFSICDVAEPQAVGTLMDNESADVSERACNRTIERFPEDITLLEKLAKRADLPAVVVERIVFKVSETYGRYLADRFNLASDYSSYLVSLTKRQVFNQTLENSRIGEISRYLGQLNSEKALNSDLLLTYVQNGHLRLLMVALAVLLDRPYEAIEQGLAGGNSARLAKMLERIGYSKAVVGVLVIAYKRLFNKA